jgi:hypothetical protein
MKITIEATNQLTSIEGVPVQLWHGVTEAGTRCEVFVHRIAVHKSENAEQFDRELAEHLPPGRLIDLRYIL